MTLKPTENQDDSSSSSQTDEIMDETNKSAKEQENIQEVDSEDDHISPVLQNHMEHWATRLTITSTIAVDRPSWLLKFQHTIYLCYLCCTNKMNCIT